MARNGENIYKRKDGRWEARYIAYYNAEGKAKYRSIYGKSRREVKEKRFLVVHQTMFDVQADLPCVLSFEKLTQAWLNCAKPRVKESTFARYSIQVNKYILPYFGKYHVSKISTELIERFVNKLIDPKENGGYGLSPKTSQDILIIAKNMIKFGNNYAQLDLSRIKVKKSNNRLCIFSKTDQMKLHQYLYTNIDIVKLGILLSLHTGIRIGELCALRWGDIDIEGQTMHISKTLQRIQVSEYTERKTKIIITTPKTKNSIRDIPIPYFLLFDLYNAQKNKDSFLLTGNTSPMEPRTLHNHYKKHLKQCGIPYYKFHTLRHTFATNYIEAGFDARSLSQILGHSNVKITLELYVHSSEDLKRNNIEKLVEMFYSPSKIPSLFFSIT